MHLFFGKKIGIIENSVNTASTMQIFPNNTTKYQVTNRFMNSRFPTPSRCCITHYSCGQHKHGLPKQLTHMHLQFLETEK